jgi:pimeloyl-ACP methyl ester carboxylesterase
MKRIAAVPNGRIAYQEYGSGSRDMLIFHGLMGSSWLTPEWIRAIEEYDYRCVVLERPGYGDSSPIAMETVSDWFAIIAAVVDSLRIHKATVVGVSAGAVYAYASAYGAQESFTEAWILAGVPAVYLDRVMRHYPDDAREGYARFLHNTQETTQDYYAAGVDAFLASMPPDPDRHWQNSLNDARANRCFGPAQESRLQITPWGFDPSEIRQPIKLWHAEQDKMVPYGGAKEMAAICPTATLTNVDPGLFAPDASDMDVHIQSSTEAFLCLVEAS